MISDYLLMHKKEPFGLMSVDHDVGAMINVSIYKHELAPYLGNANETEMRLWWIGRSVPSSRKRMIERLRSLGYTNPGDYLAKNLALSISDTYWICPAHLDIGWDEVNLFNQLEGSEKLMPLHSAHSYDSNASLGGEMDKYWDLKSMEPVLHKVANIGEGQQSVNECFASWIHSLQETDVPYVDYWLDERASNTGRTSCCKAFSNPDIEFVSAKEIIPGKSQAEPCSEFVNVCAEHGLDRDEVQRYMDYQIMTDFIITNVDRHRGNFGILRDANNLRFISPVPIFDSGNSMFFFDTVRDEAHSEQELKQVIINSLYYSEAEMLKCVVNRDIIDFSKLPDRPAVRAFYTGRGITPRRAEFISANYELKVRMLKQIVGE